MDVLVGCEESQAVCVAFREMGHNAYSCDLLPCSGGHPEWHIQDDVLNHLDDGWDLGIFHPDCTFMTNSGVKHLVSNGRRIDRARWHKLIQSIEFFNRLKYCNIDKTCLENPIPHMYARDGFDWGESVSERIAGIGKYDQIIQPWMFGHKQMKATCLWLKNLPKLIPTDVVGPPPKDKKERYKWQNVWTASPGPDRAKIRSKTFRGVAEAMAVQWGQNHRPTNDGI